MIVRDQIALYGSWKGIKLDTLNKAETYLRHQFQHGLITSSELIQNLETARIEFSEEPRSDKN